MCVLRSMPAPGWRWPRAAPRACTTLARCGRTTAVMRLALSDSVTRPAGHRLVRDGGAAAIPRSPPGTCRRFVWNAPCAISMACSRSACPITRPWLDHGRWPGRQSEARYEFLPAEGEGLHQIPVGPVHAGIIEPGHFRFTANGETVVRLEERLGYVHKGVEGLMAGAEVEQARASSGASRATARWPMPGPLPAPSKPRFIGRRRRAPCCCAASWPSWSGCRTTSTMSARSAMTPACSRSTPAAPCSARMCWRWPTPASAIA